VLAVRVPGRKMGQLDRCRERLEYSTALLKHISYLFNPHW
jgi:hypothetical protein